MEFQHINVKVFVDGELPVDPSRFINVFHSWIQEQLLPDMLIDVADYCHVPDGPGVLLVCHEADYSMDHTDGRWGLRYNRKAPVSGTNEDRLRQALSAAGKACGLLERQFAGDGPLEISRSEFEIFINDRALAPNTPEVASALQTEIQGCLTRLLGHKEFSVKSARDRRRRVGATVMSRRSVDLQSL